MRSDEIVFGLRSSFKASFGSVDGVTVVRAPGRVNLIGDHTDYNEGFVLPTTLDRAVYTAVRPREDAIVSVRAIQFDENLRYPIHATPPTRAGSWQSYIVGAVEELRREGMLDRGLEMIVDGNVPLGAGLSSSAALEVSVLHALDTAFNLGLDPVRVIHLGQTIEHRYAGVECGIMDQFVSRLGRSGTAILLDCRSLEYRHEPLALGQSGLALVIVNSRVSRELAGSKYGERRSECARAVDAVRHIYADVESLRDVTMEMLESQRTAMGNTVYRRARHVLEENNRVLRAADALRDSAYRRLGELMNASHESLRDLFEVSCDELDMLASVAQATNGVLGSRMTGAGFGGCTVNLVRTDAVNRLKARLTDVYAQTYGMAPAFFVLERNYETEIL